MPEKGRAWGREAGIDEVEIEAWVAELRAAAGPALNANRTMGGVLGGIVASRVEQVGVSRGGRAL